MSERNRAPGRRDPGAEALPRRSPLLVAWFRWYARRYVARHFHAVRISREGWPQDPGVGPLILLPNHPSWWDPLICLLLAGFFPAREHYAPIEAKQLERYRFFRRLGFFGVERGSVRGAATFLRTSEAILRRPGTALWITAQGRFADPRERPVRLEPGAAHLARRLGGGCIVPVALEYPFWQERFPEALARFGSPLPMGSQSCGAKEWRRALESALEAVEDALAREAQARDPGAFQTILDGRSGVGGLYDLVRRLGAWLRKERFRPEHGGPP